MPIQSANPPELLTIDQFNKGINQQAKRGTIDDQDLWWAENMLGLGPGNLRSMWGPSPPIYTAPNGLVIRRIFFGFYGNALPQYGQPPPGRNGWVFLSDGSIDEIDIDTHQVKRIGGGRPLWNPVGPKWWASAKVWRPRWVGGILGEIGGVLFGSPGGQHPGDLGGIVAYDGTDQGPHGDGTYVAGDEAPLWLTYADVTNTDWTIMPSGLPDVYAMEIFNSRLWVAGKDVISFSAPTNGTDFSDVNGGGSIAYFGDKLVYTYTALAASSGYLFCYGDSSVDAISQPTLMGQGTPTAPYTTVFNYTNVDPQIGHRFPRPVGRLGPNMVTLNGAGIWIVSSPNSVALDISQRVTQIHMTLDTTDFYPTFAVAMPIFGYRILLCNGRWTDPFGQTRSFMLVYNGQDPGGDHKWTVASQHYDLTEINQYEDSSVIRPFGTDGTNIYELFWRPDPQLIKRISTKALRGQGLEMITVKNWKRVYLEVADNTGTGIPAAPQLQEAEQPIPENVAHGVVIIGTQTTQGGTVGGTESLSFTLPSSGQQTVTTRPTELSQTVILANATHGQGIATYLDLQSLSPDFTIERIHLTAEQRTLWGA